MKNRAVFLTVVFGALTLAMGACSGEREKSSAEGLSMDSASVAERARDEFTLSALEERKRTTEQKAKEATSAAKEAQRIAHDANDAADQADKAFRTEQKAQESRQRANEQAVKADAASDKSDHN